MTTHPAWKVVEANLLKAKHWRNSDIARHLEVSPNTVKRWTDPDYDEQQRASSRDAKRRRKGTCVDCGTETSYNGHGREASERCPRCAANQQIGVGAGEGFQQQRLYYLLEHNAPMRFTDIQQGLDMTKGHASRILNREREAGRIVRISHGLYALPTTQVVVDKKGAIAA